MDLIFLTQTFENTNPTNLCLWTIVKEAIRKNHHCRIVTKDGKLFDSDNDGAVITHNSMEPSRSFLRKLFVYMMSYLTFPRLFDRDSNSLFYWSNKEIDNTLPDIIIASFLGIEALDAGRKLKRQYGNSIKYVPCFFDGLLSGPSLRFMSERSHDRIAIKEENYLLENADSVVMMRASENKHIKYSNKLNFLDKTTFLDLPLFLPRNNSEIKRKKHFPQDECVIFYAGSMAKNVRNPVFFLRTFCNIKDPRIHLYLAGKSDYSKEISEYSKKNPRIHYLGVISHESVIEMQDEADFLLNLGNHFLGMTPSKIFEYMSSGKPIISTYYIPNDPCLVYFSHYTSSQIINEKGNCLLESNKMDLFLHTIHNSNLTSGELDFFYKNTPEAYINHFKKVLLS